MMKNLQKEIVAIHNKNGKGLLPFFFNINYILKNLVAIHNKNGKGLLPEIKLGAFVGVVGSRNPQ